MTTGIYKITNKINQKSYIGQSINIERRFKQHTKAKFGFAIHKSFKKYGMDNFAFEVLYECPNEEMNKWETFYITIFGTLAPNGYNLNMGGDGKETSEETKKKMSDQRKGTKTGSNNHMFGKVLSEETKQLISKHSAGSNNPMFGHTGDKNSKSKKIIVDDVEYVGIRETARKLNISYNILKGRLRSGRYQNYRYV